MTIEDITLSNKEISTRLEVAYTNDVNSPYQGIDMEMDMYSRKPQSAAVLIPLIRKNQSLHVLLTKRKQTLPEHSGQVAFPGGRTEPGDVSIEYTALREANEEIGLRLEDVIILGRLQNFLTVTNYLVTPVIGQIPWPYNFKLSRDEVSKVFTIPIKWLADTGNYQLQTRELQDSNIKIPVIYFDKFEEEVLWGASARIIIRLIDTLTK